MQQPAGELIRQLRRQRSLTQTELGGDQFSKSYVSAVERGKITPSAEALRFFAQQLGQPQEAFFALVQSPEAEQFLVTHPLPFLDYADLQEKLIALLDILLESTEQYSAYLFQLHEIPELPPEILLALPKETQAHYYFLTGLIAQEKQDLTTALYDFEQALALAPAKHQPAILDNIGINYYLTRKYQTALGYHKRALHSEQEEAKYGTASRLQLKLELHCAMDYQAMNAYDKAYMHYERARQQLNSTHDMNTVGQLYLGMGYCTYAYIYENMAHQSSKREPITTEEMEIEFQNAISFLLQSRTIYQICADHLAEVKVRLMHSMVLLDLSAKRRQIVQGKKCTSNILRLTNNITLLESVQQECQQVHMRWKDVLKNNEPSIEIATTIYTALAYLIRALIQQASIARLGGYQDTAERERSLATHLCQQVLNTFSETTFPWTLIHNVLNLQVSSLSYHPQSLPLLPDPSTLNAIVAKSPISQLEVYFAAGEVAEELGRVATVDDYAQECYKCANECFQVTLAQAGSIIPTKAHDQGELIRCYQRIISTLEERLQASPTLSEETMHTLLHILKDNLFQSANNLFLQ